MSNWIGNTFGKVKVEKLVARGGMAEVYYGTHTTLNRPVAIKVLLSHFEDQPDLTTRFEREARVLAGLRHPNIVQIYDFEVISGQPFIVMEYIKGPTLATYLREIHTSGGRMTLVQIGRFMVMLASALDYAHSRGVIHRDVKPSNVLLTSKSGVLVPGHTLPEDIEPVLTDFGLLKLTDGSVHSISGMVAGTPAYMSPEQARGDTVDHRTDLYSLGVVLYEMLAGKVPFEADSTMGVLMKHIQEAPPPIPDLPAALQAVLDRVLAKKPGERYTNARELVRAFLEAAGLTVADVAPGYSITPQPRSTQSLPASAQRSPAARNPSPDLPPLRRPQPMGKPGAPRKTSLWPLLLTFFGLALVGLCVLATGGAAFIFRDQLFGGPAATQSAANPTETAMPQSTPLAVPGDAAVFGLVRFNNVAGIMDEVILTTRNLPPPAEGFQYEAWLTGEETRRSLGVVSLDGAGDAELMSIDNLGSNLLGRFSRMEITLEPDPDNSPNPSGEVVFSSGVPPQALVHVKHLLVAFPNTPNQTGMLIGLVQDTRLVDEHANAMLAAYGEQDTAGVRSHAEAIYNLLVGSQGDGYGDLDGDGKILDPGDGYGLLLNGDQSGYIEGAITHAELASQMADASEPIIHHTPHIVISSKNVEVWATELHDLLLQINSDPLGPEANARIRQAVALANRMLNGRDLDGNESIEPIEGEGGAETALEHAVYMIDMPILAGVGQLPPPASMDHGDDTP